MTPSQRFREQFYPNVDCKKGDRGIVMVDGFIRDKVTHCRTGANGWAAQYVTDSRGQVVLDRKRMKVKRRIIYGVVVFIPKEEHGT